MSSRRLRRMRTEIIPRVRLDLDDSRSRSRGYLIRVGSMRLPNESEGALAPGAAQDRHGATEQDLMIQRAWAVRIFC